MMQRPGATSGMRHVALFVRELEASERFFVDLMGMRVEWRPDPDNVYLTSGNDNLALHRAPIERQADRLDHIGFFIQTPELVDEWSAFLGSHEVELLTHPRTHRDGARSFYCLDPSGIKVQIIYHPPIAENDVCST